MESIYSDEFIKKISPLTPQEFFELKEFINGLGSWLPEDKMGYIWSNWNRIRNSNENQPCGCGSASGLWKGAVDGLRTWITERA